MEVDLWYSNIYEIFVIASSLFVSVHALITSIFVQQCTCPNIFDFGFLSLTVIEGDWIGILPAVALFAHLY